MYVQNYHLLEQVGHSFEWSIKKLLYEKKAEPIFLENYAGQRLFTSKQVDENIVSTQWKLF